MCDSTRQLGPEFFWKIRVCKDRANSFANHPVCLFENIAELEEAIPYFFCCFCLEHKQICHSRGVIDKREEISRFAEHDRIDPPAYVTVVERCKGNAKLFTWDVKFNKTENSLT